MQIFFLPPWLTVLLFFVLWAVLQLGIAAIISRFPSEAFAKDNWLYQTRGLENQGRFYQQVFKIKSWKNFLPDGGAWFKNGYAKKHLRDFSADNLELFIQESRRAELLHWLCIAPFWIFGFFAPWYVIPIMLAYALAQNMPCIMAQRYNRPRIEALQRKRTHNSTTIEKESPCY